MNTDLMFSSATDNWATPQDFFDKLHAVFNFQTDVCASSENAKCAKFYDRAANGLVQEWKGSCGMNPPYGKHTPLWIEKMHNHRNGIALVFARTDCKWFHDYVAKADAILFLKGRVRFVDGFGVSGGSGAGSGSMLVAWGDECVQALGRMKDKGHLVTNLPAYKGAAQ